MTLPDPLRLPDPHRDLSIVHKGAWDPEWGARNAGLVEDAAERLDARLAEWKALRATAAHAWYQTWKGEGWNCTCGVCWDLRELLSSDVALALLDEPGRLEELEADEHR